MYLPKHNPQFEYRLKQRALIDAAPSLDQKYPQLKGVTVTLEYFNASGSLKNGHIKCKLNLAHAKAALWYACPGANCLKGDFDLSEILAQAVATGRKAASGQLRCQGTRKRQRNAQEACPTLLRYTLQLAYD